MIESFKSQKDMKRQRYQEVYMRSNWRKQMMISALALTLSATNVAPVFASAAPDGKTNAADIAQTMGTTAQWNRWEKEWETLKNDWTQISLSPGSNATELNFAWYTLKQTNDDNSNAAVQAKVQAISPEQKNSNVPKLIIGEGRNMKNAKVYEAEQTAVKDEQDNNGETYNSNKVTATGLKENKTYYYSYDNGNGYTKPAAYTTKSTNNFSFAFVGDPQIGSSNELQDNNGETYNSNKVTATGLKENKTYYYSYDNGNGYTKPAAYTTKSTNNFSFAFVGDPQIGSSNELKGKDTKEFYDAQSNAVKSDAFNWSSTLNAALEKTNDQLSFVVSAGDQIQTRKKKSPNKDASKSEIEYTGYLSPEALKSLPVATTVGNHDADNANYTYHFNRTNASELGSNKVVGGDYYFKYGNALFIMLNTQDTNVAEHKQFIEQTVAANKDCKWRIVTLHQDIYGSAEHSNEPEITNLRYQLTPIFEQNDIDAVLTGHDHAYSRSKMLLGGTKANDYTDDEFDAELEKDMDAGENPTTKTVAPGNIKNDSTDEKDQKYLAYLKSIMDEKAIETVKKQGSSVINPEGVLYMTAGSSSGSKYYDLVPRQQTYIAHRWQEDVPTYSVVDVTENSLTINTYRTDNDEKIDETFSITKSKGDTTSLNAEIKASESIVKQKDAYTTESYRVFEQALTGAKEVAADKKATKDEVENALKVLTNAKAGLEKKATTKPATVKKTTAEKKVVVAKASAKLKSGKKKVTVKIKKASVSGYQIKYASNKNFKKAKTRNTRKTIYTIKSLRSKKKCYVKVRAYKVVKGKKIYGSYSKVLKVTVK